MWEGVSEGGREGGREGGNERGGGRRGYVTMKGVIINCCVNSDQVTTKSYNKSTCTTSTLP